MLVWRIYYDDIEVDSSQSAWDDAPSWGLIAVTTPCPRNGRRTPNSSDYYVRAVNGEIYGMDWPGVFDHLDRVESPWAHMLLQTIDLDALAGRVKFGRYVDRATFERILTRANDDPDFPPRSARDQGEA